MKSISGKDFVKILEKYNWRLERINGSHHVYGQFHNPVKITVPVHGNKDLHKGLLKHFLKQANLTEDDL